jgi:hypothetical protein
LRRRGDPTIELDEIDRRFQTDLVDQKTTEPLEDP